MTWPLLAREALADAVRRRIVLMVVAFAGVSLFFVDTCSSCSPTVTSNGREIALQQVAGAGGMVMTVVLGLWAVVLAGILASDHLAEPLEDGSALLLLARPVSRGAYALSRLAGAWLLAGGTATLLLLATGALLEARQELPTAPVVAAWLHCLVAAWTIGALAMTASLWLPRAVTALAVFGGVWLLAGLEAAAAGGAQLGGVAGLVVHQGPPVAGGMILALGAWLEPTAHIEGSALAVALRAAAWAALAAVALTVSFRRVELR